MIATRLRATAWLLSLALLLPATALAATPAATTDAWLAGTFGRVLGTDPAHPATAAPDERPLETWTREEMLELVVEPPLAEWETIRLTATDVTSGSSSPLELTDGRWVTGPAEPGLHVVMATIERADAVVSEHAWLMDVGDRPGGWESMLQRPPLEANLVASAGSVTGHRGHGCLSGFCQEAGYRPPPAVLPPLIVSVDEPLHLELADGSAIDHWRGRAEPLAGNGAEVRTAEATFDRPVAGARLTGLEPDAPGEWLLEVRADYDRERGWQWYLFRLVAE